MLTVILNLRYVLMIGKELSTGFGVHTWDLNIVNLTWCLSGIRPDMILAVAYILNRTPKSERGSHHSRLIITQNRRFLIRRSVVTGTALGTTSITSGSQMCHFTLMRTPTFCYLVSSLSHRAASSRGTLSTIRRMACLKERLLLAFFHLTTFNQHPL